MQSQKFERIGPEERDCGVQQAAHKTTLVQKKYLTAACLVENQRVYRPYKERTYHYLLQCPCTTRWRENLLLHLPEERFRERSEAMIGLILNTQATRNYKELNILVAKFTILDGLIVR